MNRYAKALRIVNPKKPILEDRSLLAVKIVKDPAYTYPVKASEVLKYKGFQVNSHIPQGNPLIEKKNLDAVEPKEHKNSGKRIKSPQQFFNPADVKPEYPKDPPQEIANRFGKLDPQSAEAMPKTGNPHVDAKVEKAKNNPDKDGPAYRKGIAAKIKKGKKKTFEEFKDITESYWFPIAGDGPTNSASQTFAFGSADSGMHYTVDGLGGQTYSDTTEVYGEPAATPNYSQLAMQGYTPPLDKGVTKRKTIYDKQDENKQKIKDALKNLGTSWEEMRANNWALVKPDGTSIMLEPITPGNKQLNWIDNSKITVGKKHRDAGPGQNPYKVKNPDGSITMEFSEIVSVTEFRVDDELNKQLDASERFTKEINADEFMKGRVTDTTKPAPKFTDVSISPEDEKFINDMSLLPKVLDALTHGLGTAGDLAIKYAKGDMTPVTSSPGPSFDANVLRMIDIALSTPGATLGSVPDRPYNRVVVTADTPIIGDKLAGQIINQINTASDLPTRLALGQFHYEINSSGITIVDRFNFNDNRHIGALADIPLVGPELQDIANRLVDIGDRRAIQNGQDPRSDNYGILIKYTIPWGKVPLRLQNKLAQLQQQQSTQSSSLKPGDGTFEGQIKKVQPSSSGRSGKTKWFKWKQDSTGRWSWWSQTGPHAVQAKIDWKKQQPTKRVEESTWNKLNRHRG